MEYTGQLIGGPYNGNWITATVTEFAHIATYQSELDGPHSKQYITTVSGTYCWNETEKIFRWNLGRTTNRVEIGTW